MFLFFARGINPTSYLRLWFVALVMNDYVKCLDVSVGEGLVLELACTSVKVIKMYEAHLHVFLKVT